MAVCQIRWKKGHWLVYVSLCIYQPTDANCCKGSCSVSDGAEGDYWILSGSLYNNNKLYLFN